MSQIQIGLLLLLLTLLGVVGYNVYLSETTPNEISYTDFMEQLQKGEIKAVHLKGGAVKGEDCRKQAFSSFIPDVPATLTILREKSVLITAEKDTENIGGFLKSMVPVFLILGGYLIFSRTQKKGGSGLGKNKYSSFVPSKNTKVSFEDVAGISEARSELIEIVESLKNPEKFSSLGGYIPKGVLLQGPPGTGKTLLAKAIAGEASVPFFSIGGSDFVEMFVGVGASRVRELFTEAKKNAPAIIFIDEIDAIGGKRSGGNATGSNDEREQTLNALLVEMDGFNSDQTVIIIAATNRPDILDPALLRPGRFDRQVTISLPDAKGRRKILEVHAKKILMAPGVDLSEVARSIPGFSGAEIANLVNEAALIGARHNKTAVELSDFEEAKDKISLGLERKNVVINETVRRVTAYHEAGHAITAKLLPETDPVHKITIMPRGRALGLTQQLPLDDRYTYSREYLINRIKILMGGRVAEDIVFGHQTTGASNDILTATDIANRLVCEFGMSKTIGPVAYIQEQGGFLGGSPTTRPYSEKTAENIDKEIKRIIEECYNETLVLLTENNKFLHKLAEALLVNETVDGEEMDIVHYCYMNEKSIEKKLMKHQKEERAQQNQRISGLPRSFYKEETKCEHEKE
ncbi:MAG: ATP-dependent zinc metalloprotease FtsH [Proteobacteria bacterium]|nr:ATP-dependent zinc metalloprotease FtsH [Pseudomonadota bacterium]MBU1416979.1 ATP-dependent zinc metalloprotease FtsH [Pseudomonadota bacterium]MBU1454690.1 ATP-dependent zinc metalloprotease FtsH [Pseudomonadota bacterium]